MANAVAGAAHRAGAQVDIKRVPELVPNELARKSHSKLDQTAPIAQIEELAAYDAIIIDVVRMGRQHVRDGVLLARQVKTGAELMIPVHPELSAILEQVQLQT
jgi:hypothetical protein